MNMIFYNDFSLSDRVFLDENNQIRKYNWKNYWRIREQDPETRREVRNEKAATKKRIHQRNRRDAKVGLKQLVDLYRTH